MKRFLVISTLVLLLAGLASAAYAYYFYQQYLQQPLRINADESVVFAIKPGSNIRQVAQQLAREQRLPNTDPVPADLLLEAQARLNDQATRIKAGEYELLPGMTTRDALDKFVSGQSIQYEVQLIEGRDYKEMIATIKNHPHLKHELTQADYDNIMQVLGEDEDSAPEGWFMPDTYHFPRNTSDKEVLKRAHQAMKDYLQHAWEKRTPNPHIKTPYEALILASIVEKESGVAEERPIIARVFLNRLEKGMRLQTDPTVIYGMGDAYDGNIRKRDLRKDTPYNTYTRFGLPPTPIAMPGREAIEAVFHPAESDYLYFVATGEGDGRHFFSRTYKEHRKAVIQYQLNGDSRRYQGDK